MRGEVRGELALLQQAVEDAGLRHGVHGARRQQVGALLAAAARRARPQQRRTEHRRQVVQRHLVLALVLVYPDTLHLLNTSDLIKELTYIFFCNYLLKFI